jgi:hypothetical protein
MNDLQKLHDRCKKIGIDLQLYGNFPWVYLDAINGNKVKSEDYTANHGYTIAWFGTKDGSIRLDENLKETFRIIRKYK